MLLFAYYIPNGNIGVLTSHLQEVFGHVYSSIFFFLLDSFNKSHPNYTFLQKPCLISLRYYLLYIKIYFYAPEKSLNVICVPFCDYLFIIYTLNNSLVLIFFFKTGPQLFQTAFKLWTSDPPAFTRSDWDYKLTFLCLV